jgi:N4-gp56 family major capsid protein
MADTSYGTNHPLAVKVWGKKLFTESLKEAYCSRFMGEGPGNVVQIKPELSKSAGDRITVGLRMQLSGDGIQGDGTLEGNEEALTTYSDNVLIDQLRHAVRSAGKMSEQRVPFSVRAEAKDGLKDWWTNRLDTSFFNQICGYTVASDTRFTGNQAVTAPSSNNILRAGGVANDQSLTSANVFTLDLIDKAVERAGTLSPMIRPIKLDGSNKYVMFLHDYQVTDLRISTSSGQWQDIQKAAMAGGRYSESELVKGGNFLGEYNGVLLYKANRVTNGVHSTTGAAVTTAKRAVLCGAQAALFAYGGEGGREMTWVEELYDYDNQLGVAAGMIFGLKKTVFNSLDFATVVVSTYGAQH